MNDPSPLVSTSWLAEHLQEPGIRILDASWHLPQSQRDPVAEFETQHIPGAVFFDIDAIAQQRTDLPHMAASPAEFSDMVGQLGIAETDTIIAYDSVGLFSAARAWWNFRIMGAENCFVLDGGLPRWLAENRPVQRGAVRPVAARFNPAPMEGKIISAGQVLEFLNTGSAQIVDVRPKGRFSGELPEPRPGLRSGHMPSSLNLPFTSLTLNGALPDRENLLATFEQAGIDLDKPIVSSCGSGVTAPLLNLALAQIGVEAMRVYDGSWAEWGGRDDLPVIKSS